MREDHSKAVQQYLLDGLWPTREREDDSWEIFQLTGNEETVRQAWENLREDLLPDFIRRYPGRRPWGWWKHDAPKAKAPGIPAWHLPEMVEPRLRIGGSGAPSWELFPAFLPYFTRGIPDSWERIDKADPPTFESEAAYLERHGLLSAAERKRLTDADFEPEAMR